MGLQVGVLHPFFSLFFRTHTLYTSSVAPRFGFRMEKELNLTYETIRVQNSSRIMHRFFLTFVNCPAHN